MFRRLILALTAATALSTAAHAAEAPKPNFLVIVADDLGYSDIGAFGGEIATPNLDALALKGVRLTAFHTTPTCSPTRAMLLSGTDNHRAGLGTMAEFIAPNQRGKEGHEGYLRPQVASLAELLQAGGYRTLLSGKWHLGREPEQDPYERGFRSTFTLLQGAHNHFGKDFASTPGGLLGGVTYRENGVTLTSLPENFYSSDTFATKLIEQLQASKAGPDGDKPFFAYLAFTAPHWPLQAHPADIVKYRGKYDAGFEVLREQRLKRQQELGLLKADVTPHPEVLPHGRWDDLSAEEQRVASRDMEIYAAMVDRVDQNVGRVIETLRQTGELDNTVVVFLADNGAEGTDLARTELPLAKARLALADNSFDNRGKATSYVSYGPGWAQAATAPSRLYKAHASEGGTRAVAFISGKGLTAPNGVATAFQSVADVVPTFLDLAGIPDHGGKFQGREVEPIRGKSWVPYLTGKADRVYGADEAYGIELFGSRAIRLGDWKILDLGQGEWQLFNIAADPGETRDLSAEQPQKLAQLKAEWDAYAGQVGVILPDQRPFNP